jgi:hypothetical protein
MYDFYFGPKEEIAKNEKGFLLFIKRMLPRWSNSIPDSEYLAINDSLELLVLNGKRPVLVETGVGASTIVLLNYAMKHDGQLFSWDISGLKGAFLRLVITDTLVAHHKKNIFDHWKFIAYSSLSEYLGIKILYEMVDGVHFSFHDSEHTLDTLIGELEPLNGLLYENSIIAMDDANYAYRHINPAYINMLRKKLNLPPITAPPDNSCEPFYIEVKKYLKSHWHNVEHLQDTYKEHYRNDLFWSYYSFEREATAKAGMEKLEVLEHRYDCWRVSGRKDCTRGSS